MEKKNFTRQQQFKTENGALCDLLESKNPADVLNAFIIAHKDFEEVYRYFLNLYYPKNDDWIIAGWDNYEKFGTKIMKIIDSEIIDITFEFEEGILLIDTLRFKQMFNIRNQFINDDWTFGDINDFTKEILMQNYKDGFKQWLLKSINVNE